MTMRGAQHQVSKEQLAVAAQLLRDTLAQADARLQIPAGAAPAFYYPGSPAEADAAAIGEDLIDDMLSHVILLMVAALDHGVPLADWGVGAVAGNATPAFAPWSVSRSIVEACATAFSLVKLGLAPRKRAELALTEAMIDAMSTWVDQDDAAVTRATIAERATRLELRKTEEQYRTYFGNRPTSRNQLVATLLPGDRGFDHYSLLSGISHSEPWAIQSVGYVAMAESGHPGRTRLQKSPNPDFLLLAIMIAGNAIASASDAVDAYRGRSL